jgi:transposase
MAKTYSIDFKLKIVKMILNEHVSKHEIERTFNVSRKSQREWVLKYGSEGVSGLLPKRKVKEEIYIDHEKETIESLKQENLLLKLEIERLKKGYTESDAKYLKKQVLEFEYNLIYKFRAKYYINELCELIDINRCGYYRWLKRLGTKTKREEQKESVKIKIKKYHELYPTKGYRNIRREIMKEDGWPVS